MVTAAVVEEKNGPFTLRPVVLGTLRPDDVRVAIKAAGMCHTDLAVRAGHTPFPLPAVLGHEGAGVVTEIGSAVRDVAVGDRVVLSFASCGRCDACRAGRPVQCLHWLGLNFGGASPDGTTAVRGENGAAIHGHFFGQSSFATEALVSERGVVKIESDVPWETLAPLGCSVQTGAGSILNVLRPEPGSSVVVYGAGGVGLAAVVAARLTPATQIIVVDRVVERLELAESLGATHTVHAERHDVGDAIRTLTGGGADRALETTGSTQVLRQAVDALAVNGRCAVVGAPPIGSEVALDVPALLSRNPVIVGVNQGFSVPRRFVPTLVALHEQGRLPVDRLVTTFPFADINSAAAAAAAGTVIKPVLLMP